MKKIKLAELKDAEILAQLEDARKVIRTARFQYGVSRSLENPKVIANAKKKIARLLTIQKNRELAAKPGSTKTKRYSRATRKGQALAKANAAAKKNAKAKN
ncbi:50S ribosomal protein L29 [Leptospira wolffii]|uniref:Large ribosomal subunit protein uL29 n=1 Tax=Leptospira wolffii TaxID=409998 RepID=A0A2M9ZGB8_9LEPT|nr:50S ribosomal protein L29 [Leptospira wolffii]EPG64138.1 ribosomal protein L29 [Leptospira wolffii serovar Khorat str. Khorat-H2]PJZ67472.1 50S ribosomal protein L29 [Leptospira wolffii]TGK62478.1 50S ribosomal protein L29 [Leptospira wolffii]TGK66021.1 50S ribosomal protein L29 [Leptospira wolffii]TGK74137.1 50S ribosomal protein L29 [Leptospira wolffii]